MKRHQTFRAFPWEVLLLVAFAMLLQFGFFPDGLEVVLATMERTLGTTAELFLTS
jgi:hypothetical protein